MSELSLDLGQRFEIEKTNRAIDEEKDIEKIRKLAKTLVSAYYHQKAATTWVMKNNLGSPPTVTSL